MEVTIKRSERNGHILYKKKCAYCQTEFWAKKIDGTCCSNACRNLNLIRKNKSQAIK
jgi:hypothetical protein